MTCGGSEDGQIPSIRQRLPLTFQSQEGGNTDRSLQRKTQTFSLNPLLTGTVTDSFFVRTVLGWQGCVVGAKRMKIGQRDAHSDRYCTIAVLICDDDLLLFNVLGFFLSFVLGRLFVSRIWATKSEKQECVGFWDFSHFFDSFF